MQEKFCPFPTCPEDLIKIHVYLLQSVVLSYKMAISPHLAMVNNPNICDLDLCPMTLVFYRLQKVVKTHVRAQTN